MRLDRQPFIRQLFDDYITQYSARDERLLGRLSDHFSGYASRSARIVSARSEWAAAILQDFALAPQPLRIEVLELCLQDLAEDVVSATALVQVRGSDAGDTSSGHVPLARLVLVFRQEGAQWKIVHSGTSVPSGPLLREDDPARVRLQSDHHALQAQLQQSTRALAEAQERLEAMERTDSLTGLCNRRQFDRVLRQDWERAQRAAAPLALVLLEVDALRHFMDRHGHLAGEACLQALALTLTQTVHDRAEGGLVARFAPDVFALLWPGASVENAQELAECAVAAVRTLALPHEGSALGQVSLGGGVAAVVPLRDQSPDDLVRAASSALARARQAGGNRVESHR